MTETALADMPIADRIAFLEAEARELVLKRFDAADAQRMGQRLVELGMANNHPIAINIRTLDRTYFHASLPGATPINEIWARRKSNTALAFQEASYLVTLRHSLRGAVLSVHGLAEADYAASGGAVPIVVAGTGMVAVATVSGLHEAVDHTLVAAAIRSLI